MTDDAESKIIEFIRSSVKKAGAVGAVLGMSGGIDSTVTAYLGARALGAENVLALMHPEHGVTPLGDIEDAMEVARILGLKTVVIDISQVLDCFSRALKIDEAPKIVSGNLKARVRMSLIYWHANLLNLLVLGTGNKTEIILGYSTKYGDAAADLMPLVGLYKKDVRDMARRLGIPRRILEKKPTAGLWPGQTDEEELGITYEDADDILEGIERGLRRDELIKAHGSAKVDLVVERIRRGQHKREMPAKPYAFE